MLELIQGANSESYPLRYPLRSALIILGCIVASLLLFAGKVSLADQHYLDMGLSKESYEEGAVPRDWTLRKWPGQTKGASARWATDNGISAVRLHSKATLTFLERTVDIDIKDYSVVSWRWKVENILKGVDERTREGDDHPLRLFFVFDPDTRKQSLWFKLKRSIYLDRIHGHPYGGRFIEYVWSSHLEPGDIIDDPSKPWQKLMVIEGGELKLSRWLSYERNLYQDFKQLYGDEPRRLIFIGILNDTDQTGTEAVSYIADLRFRKRSNRTFIQRFQ